MKLAVMQPYFLPYIGYFQLIHAVDLFVVYDNIKYTKKGWINRNRMLVNGSDAMFSLPLKKDHDTLDVVEREIAADFSRDKLLAQFLGAYQRAPYLAHTFPLLESVVKDPTVNLFGFLQQSLARTCAHLGLATAFRVSSDIAIDHTLKSQDKVLALCEAVGAETYINTVGGVDLYAREAFKERGIDLKFIRAKPFAYPQFGAAFVPWLSIIDVMMFNAPDAIRRCIETNHEFL